MNSNCRYIVVNSCDDYCDAIVVIASEENLVKVVQDIVDGNDWDYEDIEVFKATDALKLKQSFSLEKE